MLHLEQQQCASRGIQLNYNELPYCETSDRKTILKHGRLIKCNLLKVHHATNVSQPIVGKGIPLRQYERNIAVVAGV